MTRINWAREPRITDKRKLHLWFLLGCLDQATGRGHGPAHPDLRREYNDGRQMVTAGYVRVGDPQQMVEWIKQLDSQLKKEPR